MLQLNHRAAQTAACQPYLHLAPVQVNFLVLDLFVALDAGFLLGGAGLCSPAQPFQLIPEEVLPLLLAGFLPLQAGFLLLQVVGVVAGVGVGPALVQFQYLGGCMVKEVPVMSHHQERPLAGLQILLQPGNGLAVQMVGRFIQKQQVTGLDQRRSQRQPFLLSPGKVACLFTIIRDSQLREHRLGCRLQPPAFLSIDDSAVPGQPFLYGLILRLFLDFLQSQLIATQSLHQRRIAPEDLRQHRILRRQFLILGQILQPQPLHGGHGAIIHRQEPRHCFQKGGFAGTIYPHNAYFIALIQAEINSREELFLPVGLSEILYCNDHSRPLTHI